MIKIFLLIIITTSYLVNEKTVIKSILHILSTVLLLKLFCNKYTKLYRIT